MPAASTTIEFYSQYEEDRFLAAIFPDSGVCVEVGAHNGVHNSNTYHFEQLGWTCLLIEPNPTSCAAIRKARKSILFEGAVSDRAGNLDFYVCREIPELSSFDPDLKRIQREGGTVRQVQVRVRSLNEILEEAGVSKIDFITIDVEGFEIPVLRSFDVWKWRPRIIILEDNSEGTDSAQDKFLEPFDYVPWRMTGANVWYSHRSDTELVSKRNIAAFRNRRRIYRLKHSLPPFVAGPLKRLYLAFRRRFPSSTSAF